MPSFLVVKDNHPTSRSSTNCSPSPAERSEGIQGEGVEGGEGHKESNMIIDIDIDTFTYPDVPLPQVWTVEQLFDTPALTAAEIETHTRQAVRTLVFVRDL